MTSPLDRLALRHGVSLSHKSPDGGQVLVSEATRRRFLDAMGVGPAQTDFEWGPASASEKSVGISEARCYLPDWLRERRAWGIAAQLYELRSERNWGIGDFEDLGALGRIAAAQGADFVGLNPLHALFLADPQRCSPFSPSNRQFLNPIYIAVDRVEGFDSGMADAETLHTLRDGAFVDYEGVSRLKLDVLRRIWRARARSNEPDLRSFRAKGGIPLERHATFEALSMHFAEAGQGCGWKSWPEEFWKSDSAAVRAFAEEKADDVAFHIWLQWLARKQLATAAERARSAGMRIGLYLDFAVGEAPDGSATWSNSDLAVHSVKIGAPPDVFSTNGQDWGLTPLSPTRLAGDDFAPYRTLIQAAMRDAGALRLDHAMSLRQLFWIPEGCPPAEGGFVRYPIEGMIHALADTSHAHQTIMIGEDLGHVPEGFRERMAAARILSYRILYFEKHGGRFIAPRSWPGLALACLSTHDLPTLKGWWAGNDVELRLQHGLIDADSAARHRRARVAERRQLLHSLSGNAVLDRRNRHSLAGARYLEGDAFEALAVAAHRFISRTPSRLACMRLADAVGEEHPTNLPGTSESYPNWRRKLQVPLEELPALPLFRALTAAMAKERPR